jgi:peptide-methionine (R)-S-oxide reductase
MMGKIARSAAVALVLIAGSFTAFHALSAHGKPAANASAQRFPVTHTDAEWRKLLTPEQYDILRNGGTETAFTGKYWNNHEKGEYRCAACGNLLFSSDTKFESGTGWPSFWQPASRESVVTREDDGFGMTRTEVLCARCGGHLGHVFDDGPAPTHLRYCMNSAAMKFTPKKP